MTADHELTITRVFDAPRRLVFEMWTNPELSSCLNCFNSFVVVFYFTFYFY
jgi:hypothetical protein